MILHFSVFHLTFEAKDFSASKINQLLGARVRLNNLSVKHLCDHVVFQVNLDLRVIALRIGVLGVVDSRLLLLWFTSDHNCIFSIRKELRKLLLLSRNHYFLDRYFEKFLLAQVMADRHKEDDCETSGHLVVQVTWVFGERLLRIGVVSDCEQTFLRKVNRWDHKQYIEVESGFIGRVINTSNHDDCEQNSLLHVLVVVR